MLKNKILCMVLLLAIVAVAQQREMWHHGTSVFRAVYDVTKHPSNAKCGILLNVPVCGIGMADGEDVYCFDERGRQLPRKHLGMSAENCALVVTQAPDDAKRIYAYFGSKVPAPMKDGIVSPLICEVRTMPDGAVKTWQQVEAMLKQSKVVGRVPVDSVKQAYNPIDSRKRCLYVFTGMYDARKAKRFYPYLCVTGAGYLFFDGRLVHDLSGKHHHGETSRGQQRKETELTAGLHEMKIVGLKLDEQSFIGLGEAHVDNGKVTANSFIGGADFVTAGKADLKTVEGKTKGASNPVFWYKIVSYMAVGEEFLNEVELGTYSGQEAVWKFGDGVSIQGATVRRIVFGTDALKVKATVKKSVASGKLQFPENAPQQVKDVANTKDFDYYANLLKQQGIEGMTDWKGLALELQFFKRRDFHPIQVTVGEVLMACKDIPGDIRMDALVCMARAGGNVAHDKAQAAYEKILERRLDKEERERYLGEAIEFAVFGKRDMELAKKWLDKYCTPLKRSSKVVEAMMMDMELQAGNKEKALELFTDLLEGKRLGATQREAAVRGVSLHEEAMRAIKEGRLLEARETLWQWSREAPMDRGNGSFNLVRAKYFRRRGWLEGALGELDGAVLMDPLLPNLPDVEFEKAQLYEQMKENEKAMELYRKIKDEYPNHEAAAWSRDALIRLRQ
ncbi:MAG: tetratricopeptide repeat protein [Victivallales bacterium]|nr:tetratricopeptide repeat protein [Victivallales bacterium]